MKIIFDRKHDQQKNGLRKLLSPNDAGIALITVLLIVVVLVALVIELNRSSRAGIYEAANLSDGIKTAYIAKSGFYGAAALLSQSNNAYDTLSDDWARMEQISMQSDTLFPEGYFIARIEDETGKIPLNKLVNGGEYNQQIKEILIRLLSQPEFGLGKSEIAGIVDSMKDWIDDDDITTGNGAESAYYSSMTPPYTSKNAPFDCIEELLMIKGITRDIYYGTSEKPSLAAYVTADSDGLININTAPKMVLRSLAEGISSDMADELDEYRRKMDSDLSTSQWYKQIPGMSDIVISPDLITVKSSFFKIISTGKINHMAKTVSGIVLKTDEQSVKTIHWRMY